MIRLYRVSTVLRMDYEDFLAVIAIDFGTTFCGYAFSIAGNEQDIYFPTNWGNTFGIPYSAKTPTCVLTDHEGRFLALGYDALTQLKEMSIEEHDKPVRFFDKFKMLLHDTKNLDINTVVKDTKGDEMPALDLFGFVLKDLGDKAINELMIKTGTDNIGEYVRWVITVPALWSDAAKYFMKLAAVKAGLVTDVSSSRLHLVLEPEAASLTCFQSPMVDIRNTKIKKMSVGQTYLVIDAGGGTLDMAVHEVLEEDRLSELHVAYGGPIGSTLIDQNFISLMDNLTQEAFMDEFKKEPGYFDFMGGFETAKRKYDPERKEYMLIPLSGDLRDFYHNRFNKHFKECITEEYREHGVRVKAGTLILPRSIADDLILSVVEPFVECVKEVLKQPKLESLSTIMLVGGFSHNTMLKDAIKREFSQYTIVNPIEAWSAVLIGGIRFGHNPKRICARIARKTYGTYTLEDFDDKRHIRSKMVIMEGKTCAKDIFLTIVRKGDQICTSSAKRTISEPTWCAQEVIVQKWFATFNENPKYVDDPGVEKIGELRIPLPGYGLERKVETSVKFGGTCIEVESRTADGETKQLNLDFFTQ